MTLALAFYAWGCYVTENDKENSMIIWAYFLGSVGLFITGWCLSALFDRDFYDFMRTPHD